MHQVIDLAHSRRARAAEALRTSTVDQAGRLQVAVTALVAKARQAEALAASSLAFCAECRSAWESGDLAAMERARDALSVRMELRTA